MSSGSFDITVLGSFGGPLEGASSSILVKPHHISYQTLLEESLTNHLVSIDAGVGIGKIAELINEEKTRNTKHYTTRFLSLYNDSITLEESDRYNLIKSPDATFNLNKDTQESPIELAMKISNLIKTYLITHPHMDHIAALAINSPAFSHHSGKKVYGLKSTTQALKTHIFNNNIWPDLTEQEEGSFLSLNPLQIGQNISINDSFEVVPFELSHGCIHNSSPYHSTSYLLKELNSGKHLLVFGDVESDNSSLVLMNRRIWEQVSNLVIDNTLSGIIIECSTPNQPFNTPLYGHLTPQELFEELVVLSNIIKAKDESLTQPLRNIDILITHVKDRRTGVDPKKVILEELDQLNDTYGLGCHFTLALTGQTYTIK